MGLGQIPDRLRQKYQINERDHACAILAADFPEQLGDILACLDAFVLKKSYITAKGVRRLSSNSCGNWKSSRRPRRRASPGEGGSRASGKSRSALRWNPSATRAGADGGRKSSTSTFALTTPTRRSRSRRTRSTITGGQLRGVGVEVEWNNKDPFYDRDLNNFRLLREMGVLSVGVIITRCTELQQNVFKPLSKGKSYGAATTHWDKLIPKVDSGAAGGCPLLLVGMGMNCYDPNS
jgi:hypothetical protein